MKKICFISSLLFAFGCSPLKTSPNDEKFQMELTLHEVQTLADELKHKFHCFQSELQILDARIRTYENLLGSIKHKDLESELHKLDQISSQIENVHKKIYELEKEQKNERVEIKDLTLHANETCVSLSQFKSRIEEMESDLLSYNKKFDEISKFRGNFEMLAKSLRLENEKIYRVKTGDSLEKIARLYKVSVDKIKKHNDLSQDLIVVGQELKIPND